MANWNSAVVVLSILKLLCNLPVSCNGLYTGHFTSQDISRVFEINVHPDDLQLLQESQKVKADYSKPVPEMITDQGFECESHQYTTEDGYINTLHRILPRPNKVTSSSKKSRVVFLQHGLLGTSSDYVMGSTNNSLGFFLADLGYDVWLGNARGNTYSLGHVKLSVKDKEYWKFSFQQSAGNNRSREDHLHWPFDGDDNVLGGHE